MPFGLQGAPATFQWLMDHIVHGLNRFAAVHLDDLVILAVRGQEHLQHLQQVLQCLRELTAKAKKCQLAMKSCN